jgi:hypothetical protein
VEYRPLNEDFVVFTALEPETELEIWYGRGCGKVDLTTNVDQLNRIGASRAIPLMSQHSIRDLVVPRISGQHLFLSSINFNLAHVDTLIKAQFEKKQVKDSKVASSPMEDGYNSSDIFEEHFTFLNNMVEPFKSNPTKKSQLTKIKNAASNAASFSMLEAGLRRRVKEQRIRNRVDPDLPISFTELRAMTISINGVTADVVDVCFNYWLTMFKEEYV